MPLLPVSEVLEELLLALQRTNQVLLHAPTGAGKSTWLPLQLLEQPFLSGRMLLLEPRRLAAKNVAYRLAQSLGEELGQTVGYRVRSESKCGPNTRLEVITEGVLTRILQKDPELSGVSLIILDEFHERSLQADLALALLLDVQHGLRNDLKLLIMSATLDDRRLINLLPDAARVFSQGRSFAIERYYRPPATHQRFEEAVASAVKQLLIEQTGSMLVFLPGISEIKRVYHQLTDELPADISLYPLHSALSLAQQQKALLPAPAGKRKIVLSTNIAETSLTIDGINLVIDSGVERVTRFDVRTGLMRLITQRISQASMAQRAGRAGRLMPGICWHLFSKEQAQRAPEQREPEILQSDLCGVLLELLQWGCADVTKFHWLDTPSLTALAAAQRLLFSLAIIDEKQQLTLAGRQIATYGCEPRLAAMLYYAAKLGRDGITTAALLVALLEEPPRTEQVDITYWLSNPLQHWQRRALQLTKRVNGERGGCVDITLAAPLLAYAFADRIAQKRGQEGRYLLANGVGAILDLNSELINTPWLIAPALLQIQGNSDTRILLALKVEIATLIQQMPALSSADTTIEWNEEKGTLRTLHRQQIGKLMLTEQVLNKPTEHQLQQALLNWVRTQGINALNWTPEAVQWRMRVQCAKRWLTKLTWPDVDDQALLCSLEEWLMSSLVGVHNLRDLSQIDLVAALNRLLDWNQKQYLASMLPTHYIVPTGSRLPIRYTSESSPVLAVRLQEMFGEQQSPRLVDGKVVITLELLSPAHRPLQITSDLAAFWQGAYGEVKKEMRGRYPKHVWPDDPMNSVPTRKSKKHQKN